MTSDRKPNCLLKPLLLTPTEFQKCAQALFALEAPDFRSLIFPPQFNGVNTSAMNMVYASLVAKLAERMASQEKDLIGKVVGDIASGQVFFDEGKSSFYRSLIDPNRTSDTNEMQELERQVLFFCNLAKNGQLTIPVKSARHNVIISVAALDRTSLENTRFKLQLYNAGLQTEYANQKIHTHEARPTSQKAVYGSEVYHTDFTGLFSALQRFLCYSFLNLDNADFGEIYNSARRDLGQPVKRMLTHAQTTPNCSTRTFREYLRFNLPGEIYRKIYAAITGKDRSVNRTELAKSAPDQYLQFFLTGALYKAYPELANNHSRLLKHVGSNEYGYFIQVSNRVLEATGDLFSSCARPERRDVIFLPAEHVQALYGDIHLRGENRAAFVKLSEKLSRKTDLAIEPTSRQQHIQP